MKWLTFLLAISPALGSILPRAEPPVPFTVLDEDSKVKDRYLVSLKSGHTLSDHWKAIGKDLSKDGKDFQYMEAINVYGVTLSDADIVHSAVRSDTEVEVVESMSLKPSLQQIAYTDCISTARERESS